MRSTAANTFDAPTILRCILAVRPLSGCITVPGAVSLAGLILSVATIWADEQILASDAKLGLRTYPPTVASDVLSTLSLV